MITLLADRGRSKRHDARFCVYTHARLNLYRKFHYHTVTVTIVATITTTTMSIRSPISQPFVSSCRCSVQPDQLIAFWPPRAVTSVVSMFARCCCYCCRRPLSR